MQFQSFLGDEQQWRVHEFFVSNQTRKLQNGYCVADQFTLTAAIRVSVYEAFGPGEIRSTWFLDPTFGTFGKNWNQCGYEWNLTFVSSLGSR